MSQVRDHAFLRKARIRKNVHPLPPAGQILPDEAIVTTTDVQTVPDDFTCRVVEPFRCERGKPPPVFVEERESPEGKRDKVGEPLGTASFFQLTLKRQIAWKKPLLRLDRSRSEKASRRGQTALC